MTIFWNIFEFIYMCLCALALSGVCVGLLYIVTIALLVLFFEGYGHVTPRSDTMYSTIIGLAIIIFIIYYF